MSERPSDRLMSADGKLFNDVEELTREWDVSAVMAADIVAWAVAWQKQSSHADHDAEAARLVRRLNRELDHRFRSCTSPDNPIRSSA